MSLRLKLHVLVVGAASAGWCAFAPDAKAQEPAPTSAESPKPDAAALLQRMEFLYAKALRRPALDSAAMAADPKIRDAAVKEFNDWESSVAALAKAGDDYLAAVGDATPDPRALYFRGAGKTIRGERVAGSVERRATYEAAADSLRRYLDATDDRAAFRVDAEMYLGQALVHLSGNDSKRLEDAVAHLRRAVEGLQKDGRHEDAGMAAWYAMSTMQAKGRDADLRAFADAVDAANADFGGSTPTIRALAAASRFAVGSPLPKLPEVKDVEGNPISFDAGGKPLLVHFFLTNFANGHATKYREVESQIRPLWEKHREQGVRFVGVCMDYAFPKERADALRAERKESGDKREFRDGSLESCRRWAAQQGIEWQWQWDGLWMNNPISNALGDVARTVPFAVLVDKDGIVQWKGDATLDAKGGASFTGLSEAVAKLAK